MDDATVNPLPQPWARRLQRPTWRDPRLLIGVALVLASVTLGARVVAVADHTTALYAAADTLPAGRALTITDLTVVRVRLGAGVADYLPVTALPAGAVLRRSLGRGELVPATAIGAAEELTRRPVAIAVDAPVPAGLGPGAVVDVWSSAKNLQSEHREPGPDLTGTFAEFLPPVRLARGVELFAVSGETSGLAVARGVAVQVMLAEDELRAVLDAQANGARLAVVPVVAAFGGSR